MNKIHCCQFATMACIRDFIVDFFDYETPVILRTKAKRVGIIHRVIQIATLAFVFLYSIAYLKGYQLLSDAVTSVIQTRVRGEMNSKFTEMVYEESFLQYCRFEIEPYNPGHSIAYFHGGRQILVPLDIEAMFQKKTTCPEDPNVPKAKCDPSNNKCVKNKILPLGNGKMTGECVPAVVTSDHVCEVHAWCPVISKDLPVVDIQHPGPSEDNPETEAHTTEYEEPPDDNQPVIGSEDDDTLPNSLDDDPISQVPIVEDSYWRDNDTAPLEPFSIDYSYLNFTLEPMNVTTTKHSSRRFFSIPKSLSNFARNLASNASGELSYKFLREQLWTAIKNVTVIVKNPVFFPAFEETRSNYNASGIPCWKNLNYDAIAEDCPIFSFEDILKDIAARMDNVSTKDLMQSGGVVSCVIGWDCDFDIKDKPKSCIRSYIFKRVDEARSGVGRKTWFVDDRESGDPATERLAVRVSCIHFIFSVDGKAGKFDAIQLLYRLGAGAGLFSIATLLCEYIFLNTNWMVKRTVVEMKYLEPNDEQEKTQSLVIVQSRSNSHSNHKSSLKNHENDQSEC